MSETVKRYTFPSDCYPAITDDGDYVEHSDYSRIEADNKALQSHNATMIAALDHAAQRHPEYGPCDGIADGGCSECDRLFERMQGENKALAEKYNDLIMCVSNKYPGESRHDTAKRYLLDRERFSIGEASQTKHHGGAE